MSQIHSTAITIAGADEKQPLNSRSNVFHRRFASSFILSVFNTMETKPNQIKRLIMYELMAKL